MTEKENKAIARARGSFRALLEANKCTRCKFCNTLCPVFEGWQFEGAQGWLASFHLMKDLDIRPNRTYFQMVYRCTTCSACEMLCPQNIRISDVMKEIRADLVEKGFIPKKLQLTLNNMYKYGNPYGNLSKRARDLKARTFSEGAKAEMLYLMGCSTFTDDRNQSIVRDMIEVFNSVGVDFAILGEEEKCCGHPALALGEKGLFEMLAEKNLIMFKRYGVKRVVTTSPHCYDTLKNDYPYSEENLEVKHYTQLLSELFDEGKIQFLKRLDKKVVYHDPCYLGRHNNVYGEPRKILEAIPGLTFGELEKAKENSFCCGGGGGRMWTEGEIPTVERPNVLRARQIADVNPDIVVTSCPYCRIQLEDGIKAIGKDDNIQVMDLIEIVKKTVQGKPLIGS